MAGWAAFHGPPPTTPPLTVATGSAGSSGTNRLLPDYALYSRDMHAVINELSLATPIDPQVWEQARTELLPKMAAVDGFHAVHIVELSPDKVVLVILADSAEALNRIATEAGNSFMVEHIVPHLAGPPQRQVGVVPLSALAG
jgi:hypothetical protein